MELSHLNWMQCIIWCRLNSFIALKLFIVGFIEVSWVVSLLNKFEIDFLDSTWIFSVEKPFQHLLFIVAVKIKAIEFNSSLIKQLVRIWSNFSLYRLICKMTFDFKSQLVGSSSDSRIKVFTLWVNRLAHLNHQLILI